MKTVLTLTLVAALGLTVAGCGGTSRSKAYSSKQEYASALDSICSATNKAGASLDLSSITNIALNGGKARDLLSTMADKIDKLEPPAEVKDSANSFVTGLRQEADKFGELTQAAKDADAAKVKSIQEELQSDAAATSEDARFIGATGCARLFS